MGFRSQWGSNDEIAEVLTTSAVASLWLSWIAAIIACIPTLFAFAVGSPTRRLQYLIAGFAGGLAGETCGVTSLFLSMWFECRAYPVCNTAQGDMGLIVTVPVGTLIGCVFSIWWVRFMQIHFRAARSETNARPKWSYIVSIAVAVWLVVTVIAARLLAYT